MVHQETSLPASTVTDDDEFAANLGHGVAGGSKCQQASALALNTGALMWYFRRQPSVDSSERRMKMMLGGDNERAVVVGSESKEFIPGTWLRPQATGQTFACEAETDDFATVR